MKNEENNFSFKTIWSIIMTIVYFVLAYLVTFTPYLIPYNFRDRNSDVDDYMIVRIFLGIAFVLYGLFRGYRVIKFKK